MIRISTIFTVLFIFFLASTGIYLVFLNVGVVNTNLDETSSKDLSNLKIYNEDNSNPFIDVNTSLATNVNYSLTAYSTTSDFDRSNTETKGALSSLLGVLGDNKLTAIASPIILITTLSPLPETAFSWATATILGFLSIVVFISGIAAWKSGVW